MTDLPAIPAPDLGPREVRLQEILHELIAAGAFRDARDILNGYLKEISDGRVRHIETVFLKWRELPADERPDFLTYAHHRRDPSIEVNG
ncbi:hypothetical protein HKCCE4037_06620 [Rhodobacterales bacterium HKCCE4037]|nr:hypothetical protein [Rhodobacterales bacterium HKCCE4037]